MDISFRNKKLKALCEQQNLAEKKLGKQMAKKLRTRMSELMAASVVAELCAGRPHPLEGDRDGQFAVDLVHPQRLIFEPANDPVPRIAPEGTKTDSKKAISQDASSIKAGNEKVTAKKAGSIDWKQVTRVRIIEIGDYHG